MHEHTPEGGGPSLHSASQKLYRDYLHRMGGLGLYDDTLELRRYSFLALDGSFNVPYFAYSYPQPVVPEPAGTVISLVGALEPLDGVGRSLDQIYRASTAVAHAYGAPLETLVSVNRPQRFASARDDEPPTLRTISDRKFEGYTKSVAGLIREKAYDPDMMRVRVAPYVSRAANVLLDVRLQWTKYAALDGVRRGFQPNHPFMYIDGADTLHIGKQTLVRMIRALRAQEALLVKANTVFANEQLYDEPDVRRRQFRHLPDGSKNAAIYARVRAIIEKNLGATGRRPYDEECGLGLTLGTFFRIGDLLEDGVRRPQIGESRAIQCAISERYGSGSERPLYLPRTRIATSDRRYRARSGAGQLVWGGLEDLHHSFQGERKDAGGISVVRGDINLTEKSILGRVGLLTYLLARQATALGCDLSFSDDQIRGLAFWGARHTFGRAMPEQYIDEAAQKIRQSLSFLARK